MDIYTDLRERLDAIEAAKKIVDQAPKHKIRVPFCEKDKLKRSSAKFDKEFGWYFGSYVPDIHPLSSYRPKGRRWIELVGIKYDFLQTIKDAGVVSEKGEDGKWHTYVSVNNDKLIETLLEFEGIEFTMIIED